MPEVQEPKLTIEAIPPQTHYDNVRSTVTPSEWDVLRKWAYRRANYKCQICGGTGGMGKEHPVECHEEWEYEVDDDQTCTIQRLVDLVALCPRCHAVKHIGHTLKAKDAERPGSFHEACKHLKTVNGWTTEEVNRYFDRVMLEYGSLITRTVEWKVDLGILPELLERARNPQGWDSI